MHMHTAQHVAAADHLQVFHHRVVPLGFGLAGILPGRGRMRACGENRKPVLGSDLCQGAAQMAQFFACRFHVCMRGGRDFNLSLQHLARHLAAACIFDGLLGRLEKSLRHRADNRADSSIDQEIFLFDAKTEALLHVSLAGAGSGDRGNRLAPFTPTTTAPPCSGTPARWALRHRVRCEHR
jgi:hypothetical protein